MMAALACLAAGSVAGKELPRRKAEEPPPKSDPVCAYLGPGYARAPGSDTCIKVGGSVRFEGQALWNR